MLKNFSYKEINPPYEFFSAAKGVKKRKIITVILINNKGPLSLEQIKHYSQKLTVPVGLKKSKSEIIIKLTIVDCQGQFNNTYQVKEVLNINPNIHFVFFAKMTKQFSKTANKLIPLLDYLLTKNNSDYFFILSSIFFIKEIDYFKLLDYYTQKCDILIPICYNIEEEKIAFSYSLIKEDEEYYLKDMVVDFSSYLNYSYFPKEINFFISKENYLLLQGFDDTYHNPLISVYDLFLRSLFRNQKIIVNDVFSCILTADNSQRILSEKKLNNFNQELLILLYKNTKILWKKNKCHWFIRLKLFFFYHKIRKHNLSRQLVTEDEVWHLLSL